MVLFDSDLQRMDGPAVLGWSNMRKREKREQDGMEKKGKDYSPRHTRGYEHMCKDALTHLIMGMTFTIALV